MTTWYRYEDVTYAAPADEFGESHGPGETRLQLLEYYVTKETPKGVWLTQFPTLPAFRFVLRDARKRFACPTKEDSLESFIARKTRQLKILRSQISRIEIALSQVKDYQQ